MTHFHHRLSEIKARRRTVKMRPAVVRQYVPKPPKPDAASLLHIAECLRRAGMLNFADVIERAAKLLPK